MTHANPAARSRSTEPRSSEVLGERALVGRADSDGLVPVMVRFPQSVIEELRARSETDDRTMAQTVRRAVKQYLKGAPDA